MTTAKSDIAQRQRVLDVLHRQIRCCSACVAAGYIETAMPIFQGHAGQRIMIIGQAPAYRKRERPPWSGVSGKRLHAWLAEAGFPAGSLYDRCYLTSITKCFPGPGKSGKGDRAPSPAETELCRPHLDRELELIDPEVVITLGRLAAAKFLGRKPLVEIVGQPFCVDGRHIIPLPHPSGVSRWLNDPRNQALVAAGLAELGHLRQELDL